MRYVVPSRLIRLVAVCSLLLSSSSVWGQHPRVRLNAQNKLAAVDRQSDLQAGSTTVRTEEMRTLTEEDAFRQHAGAVTESELRAFLEADSSGLGGVEYSSTYSMKFEVDRPSPPDKATASPPRPIVVSLSEFTPLYYGIPFSRSTSRSIVVVDAQPAFLRSRNIPRRVESGILPLEDVDNSQEEAVKNCQSDAFRSFSEVYPQSSPSSDLVTTPAPPFGKPSQKDFEMWVDPSGLAHLSWVVTIVSRSKETPFARRYWYAAKKRTGLKILVREELVHFDHLVEASGMVWPIDQSSLAPPKKAEPLAHLFVDRVGLAGGREATTDTGTVILLSNPASTGGISIGVRAGLSGPFCTVFSMDGNQLTQNDYGDQNRRLRLSFVGGIPQVAQVTAFRWVNCARDFVQEYLADRKKIEKLNNIGTFVNIKKSCNANWEERSMTLNFYGAADPNEGDCPNMAYATLIFHEFGHALDDEFGGIQHSKTGLAYSEGFGDALSILITGNPVIGLDFNGKGKPLRDARTEVLWHDVQPGELFEPHSNGLVYAGFVWDLFGGIQKRYLDEGLDTKKARDQALSKAKFLILKAAKMNPSSIKEAVEYSFYIDSLNESMSVKAQLERAADLHKIPKPKDPKNLARK